MCQDQERGCNSVLISFKSNARETATVVDVPVPRQEWPRVAQNDSNPMSTLQALGQTRSEDQEREQYRVVRTIRVVECVVVFKKKSGRRREPPTLRNEQAAEGTMGCGIRSGNDAGN